jgi:uncharacterized protein YbjT (DUF2867 family)
MPTGILVTGGTGTVGRLLTDRLLADGHDVRAVSRRTGVDLATGTGLAAVLESGPVVVHCATDTRHAGAADVQATRALLAAAHRAGSPHVVYISIVGVDRNPFAYYRRKHATERVIETGPIPYTILRSTQFHELLHAVMKRAARSPLIPTSGSVKLQPIAAAEVAARLAELATAGPLGRVADLGGPQILTVREIVTTYLAVKHLRRVQLPVPVPGKIGQALREGTALVPGLPGGVQTWRQFLEAL